MFDLYGNKKECAADYRNNKSYSGHDHMGSGRRLGCVFFEPVERFVDIWELKLLAL
ncbi:hypothetical protein CYFUS_005828 [Cystobacter fuscus]|uniref:Uncharacterized protein n=1 Tax=Cystobacter fuscus TaxID=43 RepID=A0A250J8Y1_9BACT|nr:hypothetical protein CYFUS_005828 [Cystobacter fuscus]